MTQPVVLPLHISLSSVFSSQLKSFSAGPSLKLSIVTAKSSLFNIVLLIANTPALSVSESEKGGERRACWVMYPLRFMRWGWEQGDIVERWLWMKVWIVEVLFGVEVPRRRWEEGGQAPDQPLIRVPGSVALGSASIWSSCKSTKP